MFLDYWIELQKVCCRISWSIPYHSCICPGDYGRRREASHTLFWNSKKVPWFWQKKGPHSVHLWSTYSIQNLILRVSKRKNSKIFLRACFFLVLYTNFLSKCPNSAKQSPVLKNFWLRICCPLPWQEKFVLHLSIISGS